MKKDVKKVRVITQLPLLEQQPEFPLYPVSYVFGRDIATQIWKLENENKLPWATLFAYLFRRFGPPMWPSDDYKDLCNYFLSTSDQKYFVMIRLASYDFADISVFVDNSLRKEMFKESSNIKYEGDSPVYSKEHTPIHHKAWEVLCVFLKDMLLPVRIRDTDFNCLGRYTGSLKKEALVSPWAGYPVRVNDPKARLLLEDDDKTQTEA